jgi:ATP-dependent Clp protease ATP-binding subunit ClpC
MFERWSDDAKRALAYGQALAHETGQHYIGCDHLLVGVLQVEDADVAATLAGHGPEVRKAALEGMKRRSKPTSGALPVLPVLADIMERARKESVRHKEKLAPVHLLRALAASGQRSVTKPLKVSGLDLDAIAQEPELPVPEDIAVPQEMEVLRDEVALLRAELDEIRRGREGESEA